MSLEEMFSGSSEPRMVLPGETFQVTAMKGSRDGRVNSEWANRPDDQRYLDLNSLHSACFDTANDSTSQLVELANARVIASSTSTSLDILIGDQGVVRPNHWSFGQLCQTVGAPAGYLRRLPNQLAAANLQFGLGARKASAIAYVGKAGIVAELRAINSETYGRVYDHEVVDAVREIAGSGRGELNWKIPGTLDWSSMQYDPYAEVTKDSTTLYASDRDCFMFLVDDTRPIEVGKLGNGQPDYMFRGFYAWNSEVGAASVGVAAMYMRAVCQNRNIWGVEGFKQIRFKHTSKVRDRFLQEVRPVLRSFVSGSADLLVRGVLEAKKAVVGTTREEVMEFLGKEKFTEAQAKAIYAIAELEEGHPPRSIWDLAQGVTALARAIPYQDERVAMERRGGALLAKVAS